MGQNLTKLIDEALKKGNDIDLSNKGIPIFNLNA